MVLTRETVVSNWNGPGSGHDNDKRDSNIKCLERNPIAPSVTRTSTRRCIKLKLYRIEVLKAYIWSTSAAFLSPKVGTNLQQSPPS